MIYCSNCGAKLADGVQFCHKCGSKIINNVTDEHLTQESKTAQQPPHKKKGRAKKVLIILLVLLLLGGAFWALLRFDVVNLFDTPASEPAETYTPSNTTKPKVEAEVEAEDNTDSAIIDLPYDFVPITDFEWAHPCKSFSDTDDFLDSLTDTLWLYYATHSNPSAHQFNGGFVDMAANFTMTFTPSHFFFDGNECTYQELDPGTLEPAGSTFNNDYVVEWLDNCWMAYVDTDIRTEYNGGTYMVMWLFYIDTDDELVETLALNNVMDNKLVYIANMNLYFAYEPIEDTAPVGCIIAPDSKYWNSQNEFETAIIDSLWLFSHQENMSIDADVGHDEYFPSYDGIEMIYTIADNQRRYYVAYDEDSGEELWSGNDAYEIGESHLYVPTESTIMYNGREYEQGSYYYINNDGYFVVRWVLRDLENNTYFFTTPANIFSGITSISF